MVKPGMRVSADHGDWLEAPTSVDDERQHEDTSRGHGLRERARRRLQARVEKQGRICYWTLCVLKFCDDCYTSLLSSLLAHRHPELDRDVMYAPEEAGASRARATLPKDGDLAYLLAVHALPSRRSYMHPSTTVPSTCASLTLHARTVILALQAASLRSPTLVVATARMAAPSSSPPHLGGPGW